MNNFEKLSNLAKSYKSKINSMYDILDTGVPNEFIKNLLKIANLGESKAEILAILRRVVDLKEENLVKELEKKGFDEEKISEIKYAIYNEIKIFYENLHQSLINEALEANLLNDFYSLLVQGVHNIGRVMNDFEVAWSKNILDKNNKELAAAFANLSDALEFLRANKLYQTTPQGEICERSYGVLFKFGSLWKFVPYAVFFENEIMRLEYEFDELLSRLRPLAKKTDELAYVEYLHKLKLAFCERDNDKVIGAWQEAERAWMGVKSPLQIGHPLEYYEDNYTHAVALEWDIRLSETSDFDPVKFSENINETFTQIYTQIACEDASLKAEVLSNINKTQLYICSPFIYYGAELKGLFSAQVVPNDEFVSSKEGKKIFAFLNFVYENAKTKPFMRLASEIFEPDFLKYGRDILFKNEKIWKKVYEISTIGHEFGHIFFIASDTEKTMNKGGVFKNIEEYKATAGGLMNFFYHEDEGLKLPVFAELIKRAVGLIAWQQVDEVKPYYTEGLIHLSLLFQSGVLGFKNNKLSLKFDLESYENFKKLCIQTYLSLAKHYALKAEANEFLSKFCVLENGVFLPVLQECKEFVEFYYNLYEKIGNELDESGEFERYKAENC